MTLMMKAMLSFLADKMQRTIPEKTIIQGVSRVLVVGSGKGGVGKSTVASNFCIALAQKGKKVGLLDADIYGPSIPIMYGLDKSQQPKLNGEKLEPLVSYGVKTMSIEFLTGGNAIMWRGLLVMKALQQLLRQVEWGELDYLVIDLPPGTGDVQLSLIQTVPIDGVILVTTPQKVSTIDVEKTAQMFELARVPILGIVENMSFFVCPDCNTKHEIFKKDDNPFSLTKKYNCLLRIPMQAKISLNSDIGRPACVELFDELIDFIAGKFNCDYSLSEDQTQFNGNRK
jgi:ATP-binding protein involved in chromosome partitioning